MTNPSYIERTWRLGCWVFFTENELNRTIAPNLHEVLNRSSHTEIDGNCYDIDSEVENDIYPVKVKTSFSSHYTQDTSSYHRVWCRLSTDLLLTEDENNTGKFDILNVIKRKPELVFTDGYIPSVCNNFNKEDRYDIDIN